MRPAQFLTILLLPVALFLALPGPASLGAASPEIGYIQRFTNSGLNGILIHFDTEPNRNYELQYTTNLGLNGVPSGPWSNLYVVPSYPVNDHYIIYDPITNHFRFYRLHVF